MIYTVNRANLISEQLRKFADSSSWWVVGQFSNLDFWIDEVKSALKALNEHNTRFDKMYNAQKEWIETHNIELPHHCPICQGICELGTGTIKPSLPKRSSETKQDKNESRRELLDATYYFLIRCYKMKLIGEAELKEKCREVGTSVDLADLEEGVS